MDMCETCITMLAKICDLKRQAFKLLIFGRRFAQNCATVFFYQVQYTLFSVFRVLLCVQSAPTCTEYYATLQGEYWFTYHVEENACPFCRIQYANIFLFPFLFVPFNLWIAVNSVSFLAVLTVIVRHSFLHIVFMEKQFFLYRRHLPTKNVKNRENPLSVPLMFKGRKNKISLLR